MARSIDAALCWLQWVVCCSAFVFLCACITVQNKPDFIPDGFSCRRLGVWTKHFYLHRIEWVGRRSYFHPFYLSLGCHSSVDIKVYILDHKMEPRLLSFPSSDALFLFLILHLYVGKLNSSSFFWTSSLSSPKSAPLLWKATLLPLADRPYWRPQCIRKTSLTVQVHRELMASWSNVKYWKENRSLSPVCVS